MINGNTTAIVPVSANAKQIKPVSISSQDMSLLRFAMEHDGILLRNPGASEERSIDRLNGYNFTFITWQTAQQGAGSAAAGGNTQYLRVEAKATGAFAYQATMEGRVFYSQFVTILQRAKASNPTGHVSVLAVETRDSVYIVDVE